MRLSKEGISYKYYGDVLTWFWPLTRKKGRKYRSLSTNCYFKSKAEYWKYVGILEFCTRHPSSKIEAFSWSEVLVIWVRYTFPGQHLVVLTNLNASAKGLSFWSKLPKETINNLLQDVVVLTCKDKNSMFKALDSVPNDFADAFGFSDGELVDTNLGSKLV